MQLLTALQKITTEEKMKQLKEEERAEWVGSREVTVSDILLTEGLSAALKNTVTFSGQFTPFQCLPVALASARFLRKHCSMIELPEAALSCKTCVI